MKISTKYLIALTAALGLLPVVIDTTIVSVALVPIMGAMHTDFNTVQWIVTGYFLASAATIAAAGYLGNRYGVKRLFILGVALFTGCSLLCGLAPNETVLIACRVLQGLGGGLLIPLGQALAFSQFASGERAQAGAVVGLPLMLAPIFGPVLGGYLVDQFGWGSIFFVNLPIGALVVLLAARVLPADAPAPAGPTSRFDAFGLALSTLGVAALLYGFKLVTQTDPTTASALNPQGNIYGWGYAPVWAWLGLGLAALVAFAVRTLRLAGDPVLDLRLYRRADFRGASLVNWLNAMIAFGSIVLLPVFFQQVRLPHLSALDTGVALMPLGIATLLGTVVATRLYYSLGVRGLVLLGTGLLAAGAWQLRALTPTTGAADIWPWLLIIGLGLGLGAIPVQTLALQALDGPALTKGSSLFTATRFVFASVGAAVLTTVFVQQTTAHALALQAAALRALPAGVTPDPTNPLVQAARQQLVAQAGTAGLSDVFTYIVAGSVVLLVMAFALPGRAPRRQPTAQTADTTHPEVAGL